MVNDLSATRNPTEKLQARIKRTSTDPVRSSLTLEFRHRVKNKVVYML